MTKNPDQEAASEANVTASLTDTQDSVRWAFINSWKVEPQSNDRAPAGSAVVPNSATASAVRSMTRRKQQAKFKEWSQARHD